MVVRFLLDNVQKEEDAIFKRINELTLKDPYPDHRTAHLATFLSACFDVHYSKRINELKRKEEAEELIRKKRIEEIKRRDEERKIKELEAMAPPAPELPLLDLEEEATKKEYVMKIYDYPVGVLIDKDKEGRYSYKVFQPIVDPKIINFIEKNFGDVIGKKMDLLDKNDAIQMMASKAGEKLKLKISADDFPKVAYHLKKDALGAGLIDPLIFDSKVKEITIPGSNTISIDYGVHGRLATNLKFASNEQLNNLIFRIARATGQTVSEEKPTMNVQFSGFQINATLGVKNSSSRVVMRRI